MGNETVIYLTNIIIGVILAGLLTGHWWRQGRAGNLRYWMLAAWVMTMADVLFAARPLLPFWMGRIVPTFMVTAGQAMLLLGARKTAARSRLVPVIAAVGLLHLGWLTFFLLSPQAANWRLVGNGVIWAGLSFAAGYALRRGPAVFWRPWASSAGVFLLHGGFHVLRVLAAIAFQVRGWESASMWLQIIGDLEVSFFMVALFVSLLVAHLQQRNEDLTRALAEVHTLTGLLPICAWCRKVRDDDGYWRQLEDYFVAHSQVKFTHGICADCADEHMRRPSVERVR